MTYDITKHAILKRGFDDGLPVTLTEIVVVKDAIYLYDLGVHVIFSKSGGVSLFLGAPGLRHHRRLRRDLRRLARR